MKNVITKFFLTKSIAENVRVITSIMMTVRVSSRSIQKSRNCRVIRGSNNKDKIYFISVVSPKLFEIDVSEGNRMSNISRSFVKAYASALNSTLLTIDRWDAIYFKEFLSRYDPSPIGNRCAMEKLISMLLGLSLRSKDYQNEQVIDFGHYSVLFHKSVAIMNELFGNAAEIELKNAFNITATNFIKNLIFYGKPRVAVSRLIWIKDYNSIVYHINEFNEYFLKFGISVEESEVKLECLGELEKIEAGLQERARFNRPIKNDKISKSEINRFSWLKIWLEEATSLRWLSEWLGYKKLYHSRL